MSETIVEVHRLKDLINENVFSWMDYDLLYDQATYQADDYDRPLQWGPEVAFVGTSKAADVFEGRSLTGLEYIRDKQEEYLLKALLENTRRLKNEHHWTITTPHLVVRTRPVADKPMLSVVLTKIMMVAFKEEPAFVYKQADDSYYKDFTPDLMRDRIEQDCEHRAAPLRYKEQLYREPQDVKWERLCREAWTR